MVQWLQRLGRQAVLVRHELRPVPLEEVHANHLNYHVPAEIRGYWPRLVAKALAEDLGPILIFAPRRQSAESMAGELARLLPTPNPLSLSAEQKALAGENLARMLKSRDRLSSQRLELRGPRGSDRTAGQGGPVARGRGHDGAGGGHQFFPAQRRARGGVLSAAITGNNCCGPDEILQMFGRAGRRGLDETGFIIITANGLRLLDARPGHLSRGGSVDWNVLLGLMDAAVAQEMDPFRQAVRVQERLFTTRPIALGIEESIQHPDAPCGLKTDAERARHVRRRVRQMLNSRGEWENYPAAARPPRERSAGHGKRRNLADPFRA